MDKNLDKLESIWNAAKERESLSHSWQDIVLAMQIIADNFLKLQRKQISWYAHEEDQRTLEKMRQEHRKTPEYKSSSDAFDAYRNAIKESN